ncbi:predicted protein [Clavispora lusitaniae ATCC 42720]|uniref:Uncharacterized protein n=1 Tax=Clavispora lusitaniae (strain ATCC 42720) TaxID=306902 RepID=C4Y339_CLAL4|nr:uncharacterized protein CLUG_02952 [Clavispora lusitaniae ATCC 42720]EEQ38826.1 predicted protein [Clavispora lusitaniae ATCC 42720]
MDRSVVSKKNRKLFCSENRPATANFRSQVQRSGLLLIRARRDVASAAQKRSDNAAASERPGGEKEPKETEPKGAGAENGATSGRKDMRAALNVSASPSSSISERDLSLPFLLFRAIPFSLSSSFSLSLSISHSLSLSPSFSSSSHSLNAISPTTRSCKRHAVRWSFVVARSAAVAKKNCQSSTSPISATSALQLRPSKK